MEESVAQPDPQQGAWLVYINGIQIPCPSVQITYGVWKIPEATLGFAPHRLLQRLGAEDRLEVVVFYLDTTLDPDNPKFRLCFEGEILGWSYVSGPMGRMMSFNAIADISIFQMLHFFFMNTVDAVVGYATDRPSQANALVGTGVHYPFSLFKKGLFLTDKDNQPDIERPYDLLDNVLRGIASAPPGGVDRRSIPTVNFFARWVRKRNFINRFVAMPFLEDNLTQKDKGVFAIFRSVQAEYALKAMSSSLSMTVGEQGNMYDMMQKVFGMAYSEIAMIPTPNCVVARLSDGTILGPADTHHSDPAQAAKEPLRLVNYFAKPQMLFGIPPSCNLIFPSMISNYQYSENYWAQPTRTYVNDQFFAQGLSENGFTANALTVGFPEEVDAALQVRRPNTGLGETAPATRLNGKSVLVFPEEFYKGPVVTRMPVPAWFTHLANQRAAEVLQTNEESADLAPVDTDLHQLFFLYSQYEHHRSRYEQRGGSVDMIWNPYVVPGFPCFIFDRRAAPMDTVGYVLNVALTMDAAGNRMSTSINYGFGRTLNELIDVMKGDMARLGVILASGPVEPVDPVRAITQDYETAEDMYNALFFGRQALTNKKASADLRDIMAFVVGDQDDDSYEEDRALEDLQIEGDFRAKDVSYLGNSIENRTRPKTNFGDSSEMAEEHTTPSRPMEPKKEFEVAFVNGIEALRYISRPICTLEEYISFIHGSESLESLQEDRVLKDPVSGQNYTRPAQVSGPRHDFSYAELNGTKNGKIVSSSAVFYERIRALRPGPGTRPPPAEIGAEIVDPFDADTGSTVGEAVPVVSEVTGVPADFPQTRQDWDKILLAYRRSIVDREAPQR